MLSSVSRATPLRPRGDDRRSAPAPLTARAYCGSAHQVAWRSAEWPPPECADVSTAAGTQRYRLVRCPVTGAPARDLRGALVHVPARAAADVD